MGRFFLYALRAPLQKRPSWQALCVKGVVVDIWMEDKLLLFILFVVPGFVSVKAYELLFPSEAIASKEKLVDAVAYSCVNYALLFPIYAFALSLIHI